MRDGRLVYVGKEESLDAFIGPGTRVVDLEGRLVLPAFHDAHVHPVTAGLELGLCNLNNAASVDQLKRSIRDYAAAHPERPWILGGGWDLPLFPASGPTSALLDELVPDRPAALSSADGHSLWVNTPALDAAGITQATADPPDGRLERDPQTGAPLGTLRESAASLVTRRAPAPTDTDYSEGLTCALDVMSGFGIVAFLEANADERILAAYLRADRAGTLKARARLSLGTDPGAGPVQVARLCELRRAGQGQRLTTAAAKLFVDGVIEARTAALLEPYWVAGEAAASSSARGLPRFAPEDLGALATRLDAAGFQLHFHAIGDRAIRMALDAIGAAREANGPRDARPLIAHAQLVDPTDIPRFRQLGVVADFQPLWAQAEPYITELTEPVLGPARSRWLYPIRSLVRSGAFMAAGSDWSVSSVDPLDAIQVAVTRRGVDAGPGPAWIPEETISLPEAIALYTIGAAHATFEEDRSGSLEVGKYADLIVLDRNIFELPREEIHTARVLWTLLEGEETYRAADWSPIR